jgi:uncharacterized membrane protein YccF (DUF307 family)
VLRLSDPGLVATNDTSRFTFEKTDMKTFGNIIWHFPFFGFVSAILTFLLGALLTATVVAAPIGLGLMEFGKFQMAPFTHAMVSKSDLNVQQNKYWKAYSVIVMICYLPLGLCLLCMALVQTVAAFFSLFGIPVGIVNAKSLGTYLNPVNKKCVHWAVAAELEKRKGEAEVQRHLGGPDAPARKAVAVPNAAYPVPTLEQGDAPAAVLPAAVLPMAAPLPASAVNHSAQRSLEASAPIAATAVYSGPAPTDFQVPAVQSGTGVGSVGAFVPSYSPHSASQSSKGLPVTALIWSGAIVVVSAVGYFVGTAFNKDKTASEGPEDAATPVVVGTAQGVSPSTADTSDELTGHWRVETGLANQTSGTSMPCDVQSNSTFHCQDVCGMNAGTIEKDQQNSTVVLDFSEVCGKPKAVRLSYQLQTVGSNAFKLNRTRDWQMWIRAEAARAAPSSGNLAPEDIGFVDTHQGNDWGNRCFIHIKNGHLDWAQAACERGLNSSPGAWTKGAILYNLGMIAEKLGTPTLAADYYRQSLEVRPSGAGVSTVREALTRVSGGNHP